MFPLPGLDVESVLNTTVVVTATPFLLQPRLHSKGAPGTGVKFNYDHRNAPKIVSSGIVECQRSVL